MRVMTWLPAAAALMVLGSAARAESKAVHRVVEPAMIEWKDGPLPGSKVSVLYGDPAQPDLFVMRLWLPANWRIAPHTHPKPEILTVISGSLLLGMGTEADRAKARKIGTGGFSSMEPNTPHYGFTDEDSVIQISTTGPWTINFVNPADDPRTKAPAASEGGGNK